MSEVKLSEYFCDGYREIVVAYPATRVVSFNGVMAEQSFGRYVLAQLRSDVASLPRFRLPSNSPASAS